jgi:L,D-peptidoglycan transpeptidase YkuD (ErfK/YbiS/YcfS/YnhG family)
MKTKLTSKIGMDRGGGQAKGAFVTCHGGKTGTVAESTDGYGAPPWSGHGRQDYKGKR